MRARGGGGGINLFVLEPFTFFSSSRAGKQSCKLVWFGTHYQFICAARCIMSRDLDSRSGPNRFLCNPDAMRGRPRERWDIPTGGSLFGPAVRKSSAAKTERWPKLCKLSAAEERSAKLLAFLESNFLRVQHCLNPTLLTLNSNLLDCCYLKASCMP